eukprot:11173656-Lingulodinium_polyedra.AAC.1
MAAQRWADWRGCQSCAPAEPPERQRHALERVVARAAGCRRGYGARRRRGCRVSPPRVRRAPR